MTETSASHLVGGRVRSPNATASPERTAFDDRLLLREFTHRINNELAAAIGIVSIAAARTTNIEAQTALGVVERQLHGYAQVLHTLQIPQYGICVDVAVYLRQLCRAITRARLGGRGIELVLVEHPFQMSSERCWRVGLIVSELITNAANHAFAGRGGVIRVEIAPAGSLFECRVTDDGAASENHHRPGHRLRIIEALADSLGGTINHHFGPTGTSATLIAPVDLASEASTSHE
jgi:two-component sensor histidine kinase